VLLAERAEGIRLNDLSGEPAGQYRPALQPTAVDPFLYIFGANMQSFSQGVFRDRTDAGERCSTSVISCTGWMAIRSSSFCCSFLVQGLYVCLSAMPA
jgi:hypothetical protein